MPAGRRFGRQARASSIEAVRPDARSPVGDAAVKGVGRHNEGSHSRDERTRRRLREPLPSGAIGRRDAAGHAGPHRRTRGDTTSSRASPPRGRVSRLTDHGRADRRRSGISGSRAEMSDSRRHPPPRSWGPPRGSGVDDVRRMGNRRTFTTSSARRSDDTTRGASSLARRGPIGADVRERESRRKSMKIMGSAASGSDNDAARRI